MTLMLRPILRNFIALVPWCEETTVVAAALEILAQRKSDRLVVVNAQQQPIGIIYTTRLNLHLSNLTNKKKQHLLSSPLHDCPYLVEPLEVLPGNWNLQQFNLYLQQNSPSIWEWAVVDNDAKYLGLANNSQLLRELASPPPENSVIQLALNFLSQIVEKLPWAVVLQTSSGEVIAQSANWQEHFGLWRDSVAVRQEITELLANEKPEINQQPTTENILTDEPQSSFSRCQLGTKPGTCVCSCPTSDGQEKVWEFVKISLADSKGDLWLLVANDISYQQQLASELAAKNAELIQLNRLKDEFLACISHELKTPITAVMGLSTLLKDRALGQLNPRQERYARLIHQSGRHLMTVVNDILDLTRMETGQLKLTLEPVQIRSVCDRVVEQVKSMSFKPHNETSTPNEEHRFTLEIEPDMDIFIADEPRLRQMLVNMLSNAYKFTELGGEIGLQVNRWEGWIAFTVWDTGIGISEQQQHLIFQKFQQLENPLIRQFEGAGLGLVLTRALARLHGGDVTFLSKQGCGSSFTLLLPPSPPQKSTADEDACPRTYPTPGQAPTSLLPTPPTSPTPLSFKNGRVTASISPVQLRPNSLILVVEAAPQFVESLSEQLNTLGYRVVVARSGTEALEKSRRLQPGSIFLNPVLPMLSGWDVLTLLKADLATSQIPVIVTATGAERERAFLNQADEFISLPVQNQNLQQILNRFCSITPIFPSEDSVSDRPRCDLLTVLWLITPFESSLLASSSLQLHHRVIEADDLEQAELLARIWQPNVVVIDGSILEPLDYVQQLNKYSKLKRLPLVTLNAATTEAVNQVPGLTVFPCLTTDRDLTVNSLLAVLQVAAGISWQPSLSIVDLTNLPDLQAPPTVGENEQPTAKNEWFQALVQYLQTAGFRTTMSQSWAEVMPQVQSSSVDIMLVSLGNKPFTPQVIEALIALSREENLPPILILDRIERDNVKPQSVRLRQPVPSYSYAFERLHSTQSSTPVDLENIINAIATRILPSSLSMEELLNYLHEALIVKEQS
ncbi:MAG: response regulator [Chroococcus sp. CMT-3BRIN-NPC107]|jgi:signal transduction histidine kinase/ActR/RegA family two-component response regulator/CTP:molybdopterin cytidylyltransferase MocA|nr:response regulator [Chroococcus sp. CMT-3BRIN-NPC107]